MNTPNPLSALQALERLKVGNARFVANKNRAEMVPTSGQSPFAVILSCSDSRAPSEILFDQGLGDLFVIRVAGNVVAPSLVGSVEFAVGTFGTELVVVMGHTNCGAVGKTLDVVERGTNIPSENIRDIVQRIRPSVEGIDRAGLTHEEFYRRAVRENIRASADQLRHGSPLLEKYVTENKVTIIGAEYCIESGAVEFFYRP